MVVLDTIGKIIDDKLKEMPSPTLAKITGRSEINQQRADITLSNGEELEDVLCIGIPKLNTTCIVIYLNNDPNNPIAVITQNNDSAIAKALGYGAFSIKDDHLFVELPEGMENPFSLSNGHLYIDDSKISDVETYSIKNNHIFRGETDLGKCKGSTGNKGANGSKGATGDNGVGITKIELYDSDKIKITWSNGDIEVFNLWD